MKRTDTLPPRHAGPAGRTFWQTSKLPRTILGLALGTTAVMFSFPGDEDAGTPAFRPRKVLKQPLPPITDAPFIEASEATDAIVADNELVLGVVVGDRARAYPINQLTGPRREIINDRGLGKPITATW